MLEPIFVVPIRECIAELPVEQHWLCCQQCRRFFHLHAAVVDRRGMPRCPFDGCTGAGFDFDLMFWDTDRKPDDPRWPASTAELRHGMPMPDMEEFYEDRARRRHAALLDAFEHSGERRALGARPLRFLQSFFWMLYCCCADVEDDFFDVEIARGFIDAAPRWAGADAVRDRPALLAELGAFWRFAERTGRSPAAARWLALVGVMASEAGD